MSPFKHDSRGIDPDAPTVLLLPDGWYTMRITEAEEQMSKNKNNMILAKCSPVGEPQYADASIWHYVVFLDKDAKGAGMSVQFRKAIGVPYGGQDMVDADDWVGKKFTAYVMTEKYTNEETGKTVTRNKIQQYKSLEDSAKETLAEPARKGTNGKLAEVAEDEEVPF